MTESVALKYLLTLETEDISGWVLVVESRVGLRHSAAPGQSECFSLRFLPGFLSQGPGALCSPGDEASVMLLCSLVAGF